MGTLLSLDLCPAPGVKLQVLRTIYGPNEGVMVPTTILLHSVLKVDPVGYLEGKVPTYGSNSTSEIYPLGKVADPWEVLAGPGKGHLLPS